MEAQQLRLWPAGGARDTAGEVKGASDEDSIGSLREMEERGQGEGANNKDNNDKLVANASALLFSEGLSHQDEDEDKEHLTEELEASDNNDDKEEAKTKNCTEIEVLGLTLAG